MVCLLIISVVLLLIALIAARKFFIDKLTIDMSDKSILVTGSSAGFGRDFVLRCLDNGMTVFAGCRTAQGVEALSKDCEGRKGVVDIFEMDIASESSVREASKRVEAKLMEWGKSLHAIVNNAGVHCECFMDDMLTVDDYRDAMRVNLFGTISVCHIFKPLIKRNRGRIVTCTSGVVRFPSPGLGPYTTSKCALNGYMEVIRHELYDFGVYVITIEPGVYCTPLNEIPKMIEMFNERWAKADPKVKEEYGEYWFSAAKRGYIKLRENASGDLNAVSDVYLHAVTAKYPYRNYVVGIDAQLVFQPFSWMAASVQEILMKFLRYMRDAPTPHILDN